MLKKKEWKDKKNKDTAEFLYLDELEKKRFGEDQT